MNSVTEVRKWLRDGAPTCSECNGRGEDMTWGGDCRGCGGRGTRVPALNVTELRSGQMMELTRSDGARITVARPTFDAVYGEAAWTMTPLHDGTDG